MEVVLASGQIVYTSASQVPDLFKALKGGSNNFGIVTRFDLETFPQGKFLGGFVYNLPDTVPQQLEAFTNYMDPKKFDPRASVFQSFNYQAAVGIVVVANGITYTSPITNPPILEPFLSIQPQLQNSMRISTLLDFVKEEASVQAPDQRLVSFYPSQLLSKY